MKNIEPSRTNSRRVFRHSVNGQTPVVQFVGDSIRESTAIVQTRHDVVKQREFEM